MKKGIFVKVKARNVTIHLGDPTNSEYFDHDRASFSQVVVAGEYDDILSSIKPGDVVIDAGANIGCFTVLAGKKVGQMGLVVAIEPEPRNHTRLLSNIKLNKLENVVVFNRAIYSSDEIEVGFHGIGVLGAVTSNGTTMVKTVRLSTLAEKLSLKRIACIKMDIEGSELHAFNDPGFDCVLRLTNEMAVEVHNKESLVAVRNSLKAHGFQVAEMKYEHSFLLRVVKRSMIHPFLMFRLYRRHVFSVLKRLLSSRLSSCSKMSISQVEESIFEAGILIAKRD